MSSNTIIPSVRNDQNLGDDNLPPLTKGESQQILTFKLRKERAYLWFKIVSFIAVIGIAITFLLTGLRVTAMAIDHIEQIQLKQLSSYNNLSKPANSESHDEKESQQVNKNKVDESATEKDTKAKSEAKPSIAEEPEGKQNLSTSIVSTGSIVTLIAFILGVGLTLILTLLKVTFSNHENESNNNDCITLAGPLSELFQAIASYVKKKIA